MSYKLYAVRIFSYQWDKSLAFYRDIIGFPLAFEDRVMGWAQFQLGDSYLGLERCDPSDAETRPLVGRFAGTSVEVEDIYSMYDDLVAKGVAFTGKPEPQPWGGVLAHFNDPDGNTVTLLGGVS